MIPLLLGVAAVLALMAALGLFSRAQVSTLRAFGAWVIGLGGLALVAMLLLTGRAGPAIATVAVLGPTVWAWLQPKIVSPGGQARTPARGSRGMSRGEALEVLGLPPAASQSDIQAAYVRLMRAAHPDSGGSDWLASRINQARDTLLG